MAESKQDPARRRAPLDSAIQPAFADCLRHGTRLGQPCQNDREIRRWTLLQGARAKRAISKTSKIACPRYRPPIPLARQKKAWIFCWSGKRGSNSRPSAWEADALPTELFPLAIRQACCPSNGAGGVCQEKVATIFASEQSGAFGDLEKILERILLALFLLCHSCKNKFGIERAARASALWSRCPCGRSCRPVCRRARRRRGGVFRRSWRGRSAPRGCRA